MKPHIQIRKREPLKLTSHKPLDLFEALLDGEVVKLGVNKYALKDGYFSVVIDDGTSLPTDITVSEFIHMAEDE